MEASLILLGWLLLWLVEKAGLAAGRDSWLVALLGGRVLDAVQHSRYRRVFFNCDHGSLFSVIKISRLSVIRFVVTLFLIY